MRARAPALHLLMPKGWYTRGYIPHFDGGERAQFVTFRLADSLPQNFLEQLWQELKFQKITDSEFRKRVETFLDNGHGARHLQDKRLADLVEETLLLFDDDKYRLRACVVMPNHVHFLATPLNNHSLAEIIHSIKSYTAHQANKILNQRGRFWFPDYFDRYIRDAEHYNKVIRYIENNPVKARLCEKAEDWLYSSARRKV